jgi:hypothetical protein
MLLQQPSSLLPLKRSFVFGFSFFFFFNDTCDESVSDEAVERDDGAGFVEGEGVFCVGDGGGGGGIGEDLG